MNWQFLCLNTKWRLWIILNFTHAQFRECQAVADLHSKILDARPPLGVQILSISCSFWEILAKSYVGAPPGSWRPLLGEILDPPLSMINPFYDTKGNSLPLPLQKWNYKENVTFLFCWTNQTGNFKNYPTFSFLPSPYSDWTKQELILLNCSMCCLESTAKMPSLRGRQLCMRAVMLSLEWMTSWHHST